jgi:hypothetical protein
MPQSGPLVIDHGGRPAVKLGSPLKAQRVIDSGTGQRVVELEFGAQWGFTAPAEPSSHGIVHRQ